MVRVRAGEPKHNPAQAGKILKPRRTKSFPGFFVSYCPVKSACINLTDVAVKGTKPGTRTFRLADGKGLYVEVTPQGSKLWRYRYRFKGKQKTFAIGVYPDVSLTDARDEHQKARKQVAAGIDPSAARRVEKRKRVNTFGEVALEWWNRSFRDKPFQRPESFK
ncbi:MAG: Arm DNA-binding domain-containing protein [Desulfobacterales bacterium]